MNEEIVIERIKELAQEKMLLDAQEGNTPGVKIKRKNIDELLDANYWILKRIRGENATKH